MPFFLCAMDAQQDNLVLKIAIVDTGVNFGNDLVSEPASIPRHSPV